MSPSLSSAVHESPATSVITSSASEPVYSLATPTSLCATATVNFRVSTGAGVPPRYDQLTRASMASLSWSIHDWPATPGSVQRPPVSL